jgi:hypothetical protein
MQQQTTMRQRRKGTICSPPATERWTNSLTAGLATTAEGAAPALDHVLYDESLWHGPEYAGEVFLRQLIEAARHYIIRAANP